MIIIDTNDELDFLINYLINERHEKTDIPNNITDKKILLRSLMNIRLPGELSSDFLKVQDAYLRRETLNKDLISIEDISEVKDRLMLWRGDITCLKVDAIINAANSKLLGCFVPMHNCIDNVIHSSAGLQLREECSQLMKEQGHDEGVGDAKITSAYNLPSKYVIHTVGPSIHQGLKPSKDDCELLSNCYSSSLKIAEEYHLESIAFCCISTGVFNFPQDLAARIAIKTVTDYIKYNETCLKNIIFNVFTDTDYMIYKQLLFGDI